MTRLADIAIRVEPLLRPDPLVREDPVLRAEPLARAGGLGGGVAAVLSELVGMLEELARGGAPAIIDLRSLPMSPQDRLELKAALGEGEVHATFDADGVSTVRETHVSGVWWVEHRDRNGDLVSELLEVARVPPILEAALDEIATSATELRQRIPSAVVASARGSDHATRQ